MVVTRQSGGPGKSAYRREWRGAQVLESWKQQIGAGVAALAQDIVIPNIIELSGGGATVGATWKNGSTMAAEEINASGGILGKKIRLIRKSSGCFGQFQSAGSMHVRTLSRRYAWSRRP